ncbi:MAG: hypothetical protein J5925_03715 [Clostridia bacterium]|nr:hypothetical protein [Clostridia bacterium]
MWYEAAGEFLTLALSSAGAAGSLLACVFAWMLKKAKRDADRHREERLKLDMLRLEGEEKLSELVYAMVRQVRGAGSARELDEAEAAYSEYLESARRMKNEILSYYTAK